MFLDTVSRLTSPIFAVPEIGRKPSCDKNSKSPPISITLSVAKHPRSSVTVCNVKLASAVPPSFLMLVEPNTNSSFLNDLIATIGKPTFITPAPLLEAKSVSASGALKKSLVGCAGSPAKNK